MAAAACTVQILKSGTAEAVHDIECASASRVRTRSRKGDDAKRLPGGGNANALNCDSRQGRAGLLDISFGISSEDGHVLTHPLEFVSNLPRYIFDSAGIRRESFDYDCDAQCRHLLPFAGEYPLQLALASGPLIRRIRPYRCTIGEISNR